MFAFDYMDLFGCSPLSLCTCLGVRLYFRGLVLLSVFIYMDLFGCSPLPTWTCFFIVSKYIDVFGRSPLYGLVHLYMHCLVWIRLYQQLLVWSFAFICNVWFGRSPLATWTCLVVFLYFYGLVWLFACTYIALFWLFAFIFMNLFKWTPLFSWTCLFVCLYIHVHELVWVSPISIWT